MITIFTIPKPFTDKHTATIQTNAILSWKKLTPNIFLMGNDAGVEQAAKKLGVKHFSKIERNALGTPYLRPAFDLAAKNSSNDCLCYVNADVIFLNDLLSIFGQKLPKQGFLIVGQRWDLDVDSLINFDDKNWQQKLRSQIKTRGFRHTPTGSDYFIFKKEHLFELPDFVVGRVTWDNWMIYECRRLKIPVIDAGNIVTAIHQNHGYSHYKGPGVDVWSGPEVKEHFNIIGSKYRRFDLMDTDLILTDRGLEKRFITFNKWFQYLSFTPEVLPGNTTMWGLVRKPVRFLRAFYISTNEIFRHAQERAIIVHR